MALHDSHSPHASPSGVGFMQFTVRAKMRAQLVLPTPRGPQNRYACASRPVFMELRNVSVSSFCPTTLRNVAGRYLRALTIYFSLIIVCKIVCKYIKIPFLKQY